MAKLVQNKEDRASMSPTQKHKGCNAGSFNEHLNKEIRWQDLNFTFNRFWSSPDELPLRNVIGVVLNNPTHDDLKILCEYFGVEIVRNAYAVMCNKNEQGQAKRDNLSHFNRYHEHADN